MPNRKRNLARNNYYVRSVNHASVGSGHRIITTAVCLAMGLLIGCSGGQFSTGQRSIRVMTFNIHHGEAADGSTDLRTIADIIKQSDADIVALQDVDRWVPRSGKVDMISSLTDLTGMTYAFARNRELEGGECGVGVLTRFPILEEKSRELVPGIPGRRSRLMEMILDVKGTEILFMNAELDSSANDPLRSVWASTIVEVGREHQFVPAVVCLSLAMPPTGSTLDTLSAGFQDTWKKADAPKQKTDPLSAYRSRLDYVFISGSRMPVDSKTPQTGLKAVGVNSVATSVTDHRAITVDLQIVSE